jgi:hypothetical protein
MCWIAAKKRAAPNQPGGKSAPPSPQASCPVVLATGTAWLRASSALRPAGGVSVAGPKTGLTTSTGLRGCGRLPPSPTARWQSLSPRSGRRSKAARGATSRLGAGMPSQSGPPNVARIPHQHPAGHGGPQTQRRKRAAFPLIPERSKRPTWPCPALTVGQPAFLLAVWPLRPGLKWPWIFKEGQGGPQPRNRCPLPPHN